MGEPVQSITIVGGGTSGWLTAAFLARMTQSALKDGELIITLIESPNIPIIGVGEATAPGLPNTFKLLGINERDFITKSNAAFKLSGYFHGWNVDRDGAPVRWINPFLSAEIVAGRSPGYHYLEFGRDGAGAQSDFSRAISVCPDLIDHRKGPRALGAADYESVVPYAYHMDALEVAKILRDQAKKLGVKHILDDVTEVKLDERGFVDALALKKHGRHKIELVIDATGFAGVVINKAMGEPFDSFGHILPNDRAAVVQIDHENPDDIEPTSRATALGAGWAFNVPLYNRVGTGYIFSSNFISDDDAIAELTAHLGSRVEGKTPRIIPMRIGKSRRSWVKNCIAVGLSSGFIEPLEATAIHSVDLAIRWIYTHFPDKDFDPALSNAYNRLVDKFYEEITDFIVLHFKLNNRTDTDYWRTAREDTPAPDSLNEKLALWRRKMPGPLDMATNYFFSVNNYLTALMGKGFYDGEEVPQLPGLKRTEWENFTAQRAAIRSQVLGQLPNHVALLRQIRGEAAPPPAPGLAGVSIGGAPGVKIQYD